MTTTFDMKVDRINQLYLARKFRDSKALYALSELFALEDDMEKAETLREEVEIINKEDQLLGELRNNNY